MLTPVFTKQFKRDWKKAEKRKKDSDKLTAVMEALIDEKSLPAKNRDHALSGNFSKDRHSCRFILRNGKI